MDGYRTGNRKTASYRGARRGIRTAPSLLARVARCLSHVLSTDKTVSAFRYALAAASFVFLLSVVAAMETGIVSLGAGVAVCVAIGTCYLLISHRLGEDGEED